MAFYELLEKSKYINITSVKKQQFMFPYKFVYGGLARRIMKTLHKCYIGLVSTWKILWTKICLHGKFQSTWINSIRGVFKTEIIGNGNITVGRFLMSRGPLYLKSVNGGKVTIGENVFFNHNCSITCAESITIGEHCMFANNLVIVDHDHIVGEKGVTGELISKPVIIENQVWCGANVTITKGVHIGRGAVIAAGAVVTNDVPERAVMAGVPARRIR